MAKKIPQNAIIINGKVYELVDNKDYQTNTYCDICDLKKLCPENYGALICVELFGDADGKTFKLIN